MNSFSIPKKTYILFLAGVFPEDAPDEDQVLQTLEIPQEPEEEERKESPLFPEEEEEEELPLPNLFAPLYQKEEHLRQEEFLSEEEYEPLPRYFTDAGSWVKSTNLLCASCDDSFFGVPYFAPVGYVKLPPQNSIDLPDPGDFLMLQNFQKREVQKGKEVKAIETYLCFCTPVCASRYIRRVKDPRISKPKESLRLLAKVFQAITGLEVEDIPEGEDKTTMVQYSGSRGISRQKFRERNANKMLLLQELSKTI